MLKIRARQICPNYTRVIEVENAVMFRRESEETTCYGTYMIGCLNTEEKLEKLAKKGLIMGLARHKEGSHTVYTFDFVYPFDLISMEEYTALVEEFNELERQPRNEKKYKELIEGAPFIMRARHFGKGYTRVIEVAHNALLVKRQTEEPACIVKWIDLSIELELLHGKRIIHNLDSMAREKIYSFDLYYPYELISMYEFICLSYAYVELEHYIKDDILPIIGW
ncbi:hypothetical protein [Paenibacillus larvae]|uniref:hypothetical protein n=1 Tax=Paenibacillus larvae TaxID=1464 RepID=UPI0003FB2E43|nr:hypothetical protein [Paenibacillus larvae]MDR5566980.1 hypothetical protein [Paenibacillus larvae]MDR5595024.1 hypothetical protein [Paenibacillus larvae]